MGATGIDLNNKKEIILKSKKIIWTGAGDTAGYLFKDISSNGAVIEHIPLICVTLLNSDEARQAFLSSTRYSFTVFTSYNAVDAVAGLAFPKTKVACVGPSTAARLKKTGWEVHIVPKHHDAKELAEAIIINNPLKKPVLFLKGNNASSVLTDTLKKALIETHEVVVYKTGPSSPENSKKILKKIREGIDAVIIGSPMGAEALFNNLTSSEIKQLPTRIKWICLGRTTKKYLKDIGISAFFPDKVTHDTLNSLLCKLLADKADS